MTLFLFKASAKYCAPIRPILVLLSINAVNACKKIENKSKKELEILLYCPLRHQLSIVLQYL